MTCRGLRLGTLAFWRRLLEGTRQDGLTVTKCVASLIHPPENDELRYDDVLRGYEFRIQTPPLVFRCATRDPIPGDGPQ